MKPKFTTINSGLLAIDVASSSVHEGVPGEGARPLKTTAPDSARVSGDRLLLLDQRPEAIVRLGPLYTGRTRESWRLMGVVDQNAMRHVWPSPAGDRRNQGCPAACKGIW